MSRNLSRKEKIVTLLFKASRNAIVQIAKQLSNIFIFMEASGIKSNLVIE